MRIRKGRPYRLYDVLLVVVSATDADAPDCTTNRIANVLGLKPSTYVRGLINELVAVEFIDMAYLRERFGHSVYSYYPTRLGREMLQKSKYLRALFLNKLTHVRQEEMEL